MDESTKVDLLTNGYSDRPDDCWNWLIRKVPDNGRVRIRLGNKMVGLARTVWALNHGPLTDDSVVKMICGNPRCFNTSHMQVLTISEFRADRVEEFRPIIAERHAPDAFTYFRNLAFLQDSNDDKISYHGLRLTEEEFTARWIPGRGITSGIFTYAPGAEAVV